MKMLEWIKNKKNEMFVYNRNKKTKIGLALGGGGARGFAHLGAIKAFEEYGLSFDYVAGTSVGSLVGAFYASGKKFQEIYDIAKEVRVKDIRTNKIFFMPSKTDGLENLIETYLKEKNVEELKIPFAAVAVDLISTKETIITKGQISKAVAGSCCVPGFFQPVEFQDCLLCDGGLQNNIPASVPKMMGCDYVVAVDVNPSRGYGTESSKLLDVLSCSIRILMKSNSVKGYVNSDIMIKPDTKRFKSTKSDGFEEMVEEGYEATIKLMPEILRLFGNHPLKKKNKANNFDEGINII